MSSNENEAYLQTYFHDCEMVSHELADQVDVLSRIVDRLFSAWEAGNTVYVVGNGGSAGTATHFVADLVKTTIDRPTQRGVRAMALVDNIPLVSAATNDWGWGDVYQGQLRTFWRPGDVVIGFSVHGGLGSDRAGAWSQNLLKALQFAKDNGGTAIGFSGYDGGAMHAMCDLSVVVPAETTPLVEAFHVVLFHGVTFRLKERIAQIYRMTADDVVPEAAPRGVAATSTVVKTKTTASAVHQDLGAAQRAKIFIDSANLHDVEEALKRGFPSGVTTNPSIIAKEPKTKFEDHVKKLIEIIRTYRDGIPLSIEVFERDADAIRAQAEKFIHEFGYENLSIKVQVGWDELQTVHALAESGISVNCTACMTVSQALLAAQAGARYVSLFWGRIRDAGTDPKFEQERAALISSGALDPAIDFDPADVVRRTRALLDAQQLPAEIIVGSIRGAKDIVAAGVAGAHIVTVPPKFFTTMASHYKTTEVIDQFLTDFAQWMQPDTMAR